MKKIMKLLYIVSVAGLCCLFSFVSFAGIGEKLEGHWSKDLIKEQTIAEFFPKLAENNFENLSPSGNISISDTASAFSMLYKKYNKEKLLPPSSSAKEFRRKEILMLLVPALKDTNGKLAQPTHPLPYLDCESLTQQEIYLLQLLTEQHLIKGNTKTTFLPNNIMTQSEVIILLQRLESHFLREQPLPSEGRLLPFQILESSLNYNDYEGIQTDETDDTVRITITMQFPTPGYSFSVQKMILSKNGIEIVPEIVSPPRDSEQLQVITYYKTTVEIKKADIPSDAILQFTMKGLRQENNKK